MPTGWFLTAFERGNPATRLDRRHADGSAWTRGNAVEPLVHGATYFRVLLDAVRGQQAGDLLLFTDWRGDPDELLAGPGTEVSRVLCEAATRGVLVRGLVWRSHLDKLQFSAAENRHLGTEIELAGGEVLLDMRVRAGGSHHQKFVVLRHPGRPERDVAFVGGIDLCHSRNDDASHAGDRQRQSMSPQYGDRPPWHDVQVAVRGPAVGDVETVFRERWDDPSPVTRNPLGRLRDAGGHEPLRSRPLPPQLPDPAPCGSCSVQLLRTYPFRGRHGYPFAVRGERSVALGYAKALRRARRLVFVEDQYAWSAEVADVFASALRDAPDLHLMAVIPRFPDQNGRVSEPPNLVGRISAFEILTRAGGNRFAAYSPENHDGVPVYVHAKVCIIDDTWASVGSDNLNRRSWTHDSELGCAVLDEARDERDPVDPAGLGDGARAYARSLRLQLTREHLDRTDADDVDLLDPMEAFNAVRRSADRLEAWYAGGRTGARPPGRLRPYHPPAQSRWTKAWATPVYRTVYDPDGRSRGMRRAGRF